MSQQIPAIVLGGSGYVAGEFLRLVHAHPSLKLGATVSSSQAGEPIAAAFDHLAFAYPEQTFATLDATVERLETEPRWLVLSAAPHGAAAGMIGRLLDAAAGAGVALTVVDASADFRFASAADWEAVYGHAHAAPERLPEFTCALPEQLAAAETPHVAHPGCFSTAMLLGIVPLTAAELAEPEYFVSAVTGSTGAGRTPRDTTHHPLRQSNLFAYQVLKHRHSPEVRALTRAATGRDIGLHFVPHSGSFARGIHATVFAKLRGGVTERDVREALAEYYRNAAFVRVAATPPRLKDIAASNYAVVSASVQGDTIVVCSVIDNLLKGAAGGCMQWANRLLGWPEGLGLETPSPGWL